ncbi:hypothetical protein IJF89_00805 [Candidatus Saccharibacteria bacterium]|nr:hypothetical protein [Candidatus Saccharibacteria bacterium]
MSKFQKLRLTNLIIQLVYIITLSILTLTHTFSHTDQPVTPFGTPRSILCFTILNICLYFLEFSVALFELHRNHLSDPDAPKIYHAASGPVSVIRYILSFTLAFAIDIHRTPFLAALCFAVPTIYALIYFLDRFFDFTARLISPDPFIKPPRINRHHQIH